MAALSTYNPAINPRTEATTAKIVSAPRMVASMPAAVGRRSFIPRSTTSRHCWCRSRSHAETVATEGGDGKNAEDRERVDHTL